MANRAHERAAEKVEQVFVEMVTQTAKRLSDVLRDLAVNKVAGSEGVEVSGVEFDSRSVKPGDVFVALPGAKVDGHGYIEQARRNGAAAVVVSRAVDVSAELPVVSVDDTRVALALISANFWDHPSLELALIGITGTNGKTTLTYMLEAILRAAGLEPGVLGTTGARFAGRQVRIAHTTPEASHLQRLFREMVQAGVSQVAMEVSSHALDLDRVRGCQFRLGVFTNLSRDHLDYHGDLDNYARTKALLFSRELNQSRARGKAAVVNSDDPRWEEMTRGWNGRVLSFGCESDADVHPVSVTRQDLSGFGARVAYPGGQIDLDGHLPGEHNLSNAMAALAVSLALDIDAQVAAQGIADCRTVPGRLQRIQARIGPAVFVDYAHTDSALKNVLGALKPLTRRRLLVVFGCGGDRDRGKRPMMGEAVARGSDLAVVTSDNPRTEEPLEIIEQILPGLVKSGWKRVEPDELAGAVNSRYAVLPERGEAIRLAIRACGPDDVVLIAGKGHEDYQEIGTTRKHFDDCEEARCALEALQSGDTK